MTSEVEAEVRGALVAAGVRAGEIELAQIGQKVGGFVISERFAGRPHVERQQWLDRELRARLSPEVMRDVVVILLMTPGEIIECEEMTGDGNLVSSVEVVRVSDGWGFEVRRGAKSE